MCPLQIYVQLISRNDFPSWFMTITLSRHLALWRNSVFAICAEMIFRGFICNIYGLYYILRQHFMPFSRCSVVLSIFPSQKAAGKIQINEFISNIGAVQQYLSDELIRIVFSTYMFTIWIGTNGYKNHLIHTFCWSVRLLQ